MVLQIGRCLFLALRRTGATMDAGGGGLSRAGAADVVQRLAGRDRSADAGRRVVAGIRLFGLVSLRGPDLSYPD